jgi:hypothetical protein
MEAQLKLPIFEKENVEKSFEFSAVSQNLVRCGIGEFTVTHGEVDYYVRKENDFIFIHIASLNLLGKRSGTLFRFMNIQCEHKTPHDVVIPELKDMPKERIIEFINNVVKRHNNREFAWDYEHRCNIYTTANQQ